MTLDLLRNAYSQGADLIDDEEHYLFDLILRGGARITDFLPEKDPESAIKRGFLVTDNPEEATLILVSEIVAIHVKPVR